MTRFSLVLLPVLFLSPAVLAQSGHWEGSALVQNSAIHITLDLAQSSPTGAWTGTMSFPDQKTSAMKLTKITVEGKSVSIESPAVSQFTMTVADDGKSMKGSIQLGRGSHVVRMTWVSDPVLQPAPVSTAISKQLEGSWEGTLKYEKTVGQMTPPEGTTPEGATFGLHIRFSNGADRVGIGELSRLDEPNAIFPLDRVVQDGENIRFEFYSAAVVFEGKLNGDQVSGEWRQVGADPMSLSLKRVDR